MGKQKPRPQHIEAARLIAEGALPKDALAAVGFCPDVARRGMSYIRRIGALKEAVKDAIIEYKANGGLTGEQMKMIAEVSLATNAMKGEKNGCGLGSTNAAIALGKHKDVRIFEPENVVNILNLNVPPGWEQRYEKP